MVRVHDHREVARAGRQQRVVAEPEDGRDVVEAGPAKARASDRAVVIMPARSVGLP